MGGCAALKSNGEHCRGIAATGSEWCPAHNPARKEARKRAASRAARSKPSAEIADLKRQLRGIAHGTLTEKLEPRAAAVSVLALNALVRVLELERRVLETEALEQRLVALETELTRR